MIAKVLDYQSKQIAYNLYAYLKKRKLTPGTREHENDINLIDTVAEATGLSKTTVTRIIREGNVLLCDNPDSPVVFPPQEKVRHVRAKRIAIPDETEGIIRRKVTQFYSSSNEVPSVKTLNALLREEGILKCSDEYLRQLLYKLGFTNSDDDSSGRFKECTEIVKERLDYLKTLKDCRDNGKNIFYLCETKRWNDTGSHFKNNADMPAFIMVHGSGPDGFSDGSNVIVKMKPSADLIMFEVFQNYDWMKDNVLPNLPSGAVIVMNMPQCESHTALKNDPKPPENSTRATMEKWLERHNIYFMETEPKDKLVKRIANVESNMRYSLTKLLEENGFQILYLPQKNQDLTPITIMWDELKEEAKNTSPADLIMGYDEKKLEQCCAKVKVYEQEYYTQDQNFDFSVTVKAEGSEKRTIKQESGESDMDADDNDNEESNP